MKSNTSNVTVPNEIGRERVYSDDEQIALYELGRFLYSVGSLRRAEMIAEGLIAVAPRFAEGWLLRAVLFWHRWQTVEAEDAVRQSLRCNSDSLEASLLFVSCLLTRQDLQSAGTFLGEIGERMAESSKVDQRLRRFYESQIVRYQYLSKKG